MKKKRPFSTDTAGFTLVELLVVVAILGILAAIALPRYGRYVQRSKATADLARVKDALKLLAIDTSNWPAGKTPFLSPKNLTPPQNGGEHVDLLADDIGLFNNNGSIFTGPDWEGPYLPTTMLDPSTGKFLDPWGTPYFMDYDYQINGEWFAVVGSYGPNKQGLNMYDSDDIYMIVGR